MGVARYLTKRWVWFVVLTVLAVVLCMHVPHDTWQTHEVTTHGETHHVAASVEAVLFYFATFGAFVAFVVAAVTTEPRVLQKMRASRLRVIEENGWVILIRTPGDGRVRREELGRWAPEQAEEAIDKMVEARLAEKQAAERLASARRIAKRLDKNVRR